MTPSICERRWTRLRATALGWKPVLRDGGLDRRGGVSGETSGRLLMTRETVCVETPVIAAISLIVTLCWRCKSSGLLVVGRRLPEPVSAIASMW